MKAQASRITRYQAEPDMRVRPLDDISLVYHRHSGQTHLVVSPVPEILAALGTDVCAAADVVARLSATYDLGAPDAAAVAIAAHLEELAALGLVRRA